MLWDLLLWRNHSEVNVLWSWRTVVWQSLTNFKVSWGIWELSLLQSVRTSPEEWRTSSRREDVSVASGSLSSIRGTLPQDNKTGYGDLARTYNCAAIFLQNRERRTTFWCRVIAIDQSHPCYRISLLCSSAGHHQILHICSDLIYL